jgi:uncharacterized protein (DUF58 family)
MDYASLPYSKADYGRTLAATLAHFLNSQHDAVGLVTFDAEVRDYLPPRYRPGHLHRLMLALERPCGGQRTCLSAPLRHVAELVTRRSLLILVSDLLAPIDALEEHLARLASQGHEVCVFQVLDPAEISFDFQQPVWFEDAESRRRCYVDPAVAREGYLERFGAHLAAIQATCDKLGIEYHRFSTDRSLEWTLFEFLKGRALRSRGAARTRTVQPRRGA